MKDFDFTRFPVPLLRDLFMALWRLWAEVHVSVFYRADSRCDSVSCRFLQQLLAHLSLECKSASPLLLLLQTAHRQMQKYQSRVMQKFVFCHICTFVVRPIKSSLLSGHRLE